MSKNAVFLDTYPIINLKNTRQDSLVYYFLRFLLQQEENTTLAL